MKEAVSKINRIYLIAVTSVQAVLAVVLLITSIKDKTASLLSLLFVAAVIFAVSFFLMKKNKMWICVAIFVLTMPVVMDSAVSKDHFAGLPNGPKGTIEEIKVQRLVWPYISEMGYSYGLDVMDDEAYIKLAISSESLWKDFFPAVESQFGDYSQEIYKRYVELSLESQKRKLVPDILSDFADYFFAPIVTEFNFYGRPGSLNGKNYQAVKDRMGDFGRMYFHFGFAALVGVVLLGIINMLMNKGFPGVIVTVVSIALVVCNSLYSIFFPLRGFDYKNAVLISAVWGLYWCMAMRGKNADR